MEKENTKSESASRVCYEAMEAYARERIQNWLQGYWKWKWTSFWEEASRCEARGAMKCARVIAMATASCGGCR